MSIETAQFIDELDENWPTNIDNVSEGDDHLRLIKSVLKSQFPNLDSVVTATPAELNDRGLPTGSLVPFAGITVPSGFFTNTQQTRR